MSITKAQVLEELSRNEGALGKAAMDEPIFVLRAQDVHAAELVLKWATWTRAGTTPEHKVDEAFRISEAMSEWHTHKQPD
jgi:hypothetical protein